MFFLHITGAQKPQKETNVNITANVSFSLAPMEEHVTMKSQCYIHVHVQQHMEELIAQNVCDNNCAQPNVYRGHYSSLRWPDAKILYQYVHIHAVCVNGINTHSCKWPSGVYRLKLFISATLDNMLRMLERIN